MSFGINEYNAWLSDPEAERILLAVVRYHDGVSEHAAYFSSGEYQTEPDDSLPNIAFDSRLIGDPSITLSVPWLGDAKGEDDFSDLEITNADAALDDWGGFSFAGRGVTLLLGAPDWPYANFLVRPLLEGIIDGAEFANDDTISLTIRDRMGELDGPIQNNLLSSGPKEGEPVPLAWGLVRNAELILVDSNDAGGRYQWHDGLVSSADDVYDNGVMLSSPGDFSVNVTAGTVTKVIRPAGTMTFDGKGAAPGGVWLSSAADIARDIVCRLGPLSDPDDLDTDSFTALNADAGYTPGIFVSARANRLDVLDKVLESVSARYFFDSAGKLHVGRIQDPAGQASDVTLTGDTEITALSIKPLNQPQWRTRLGYEKNWTVQPADRLAGSITDANAPDPARVGWLGTEFRTAVHPSAAAAETGKTDPDRVDTLIDAKSDAETEAQYRQEILGVQRHQVNIEAHAAPFQLLPLHSFTVVDRRYGLEAGKKMQALSVQMFYLSNRSEVEAWF